MISGRSHSELNAALRSGKPKAALVHVQESPILMYSIDRQDWLAGECMPSCWSSAHNSAIVNLFFLASNSSHAQNPISFVHRSILYLYLSLSLYGSSSARQGTAHFRPFLFPSSCAYILTEPWPIQNLTPEFDESKAKHSKENVRFFLKMNCVTRLTRFMQFLQTFISSQNKNRVILPLTNSMKLPSLSTPLLFYIYI